MTDKTNSRAQADGSPETVDEEHAVSDAPGGNSADRSGKGPIKRNRTHESGYGGKMGEPKTSSDQREPPDPN